MSSNRRGFWYWVYIWLPVALGIGVIVVESTEAFGADHTSGPLRRIFEALFGHVSAARWEIIHHYVRKSGHFLGYGFIGLAWLRAWWFTLPRSRFIHDAFLALLGTAIVASCDEWHQTFLPNRTGSPWDVLLDCTGAIALQLIVYIFMRTFKPKRLARAA
ncbi:MAG TPA: VanZ family protein [Terracidiphilus sp.]|jgi:VanZ family protein|nr:VanZ family protein [Terracidiphilus sp.]